MRTRTIVLCVLASVLAGAIIIATSADGEAPAAASDRTAEVAAPTHGTPVPALSRVLGDLHDRRVEPQDGYVALLEALKSDPTETLAVLEAFLADADPRDPATSTAVAALVAAGTPEIQEGLVRLLDARVADTAFVKVVVPTLGFLEKPTVATERAIRGLTDDDAPEATRMNAHLTLGVMASRFGDVDARRGTAIVDEYVTKLATAKTADERKKWLSVLGNAGTPAAAKAIEAQLDATDPVLRGQALEALRRVASPEADARLVHALDDGDARVRASAAWSLSHRQATPETLSVLLGKLARELDEKVAIELLDVVWPRRATDLNAVLATVRSLADSHPVAAVRAHAKTLLDQKA